MWYTLWICKEKTHEIWMWASGWPDVNRLCGSGAVGQSVLLCVELGKPETLLLLGMGFGCLKLLLSENSDCDSVPAPSKGDRTVKPATLAGATIHGWATPGGGDGESLQGIWVEIQTRVCVKSDGNHTGRKRGTKSSVKKKNTLEILNTWIQEYY